MLPNETCWFIAVDFDQKAWKDDASSFVDSCREWNVPTAPWRVPLPAHVSDSVRSVRRSLPTSDRADGCQPSAAHASPSLRDRLNVSLWPVPINTSRLTGGDIPAAWMHRRAGFRSNGACPLPVSLAFLDALHRTPAFERAEVLRRRAPLAQEPGVAARPVTTGVEKTS